MLFPSEGARDTSTIPLPVLFGYITVFFEVFRQHTASLFNKLQVFLLDRLESMLSIPEFHFFILLASGDHNRRIAISGSPCTTKIDVS